MSGDGNLRIFDISDPARPFEVGYYSPPKNAGTRSRVIGAALAGTFAYVAADHANLRVVDVSDPTNPIELGVFKTPEFGWELAVS